MRRICINLVGLLVLFAISVLAVNAARMSITAGHSGSPTGNPNVAPGVPGIPPTLDGVPAFTEQDVRTYVETHPFRHWDRATALPVVTNIEFLPNQAVEALHNISTGLPPDALVCMVTTQGDFVVHGPPGMTYQGNIAYQIFDARTGNLLVRGVR